MPRCPNCKVEINQINYFQSGQIEFGGNIKRDGWWYMQDPERILQCPECDISFDAAELDALGVPQELR